MDMGWARWGEAAAGAAAAYAFLGEPFWVRGVTYTLSPKGWPPVFDGLTIVHLSDLHGRTTAFRQTWVWQWIEAADLIAVTGDLYSPTIPRERLVRELLRLPPDRTRLVSGNHDYRHGRLWLSPYVPPTDVLLDNRWETRTYRGAPWVVAGLPDLVKGRPEWDRLREIPAELPKILLAHRPDVVLDPRAAGFAVVLAGHTHGGQVALPGFGPILRHSRLPRGETAGLVRRGDQYLVVSRGLGTSELPVRFWSRPEVIRIQIRLPSAGRSDP
jgi:predicted MPP superfamily phosphohydrolase